MNKKNFVISFSGGKDSVLALYRMIKSGHKPLALLTTTKKNEEESWTHNLKNEMLDKVSKSMGIPILKVQCDALEYEVKFEEALKNAKNMGADTCVFGDIDIASHKEWGVDRCKNSGLLYEYPLWQEDREKLVYEFIDSGFKTIIKTVNLKHLGVEFLGKILSKEVAQNIRKTGSDMCGENGEYHTFVVDGPIFKNSIDYKILNKRIDHGYGHLDII